MEVFNVYWIYNGKYFSQICPTEFEDAMFEFIANHPQGHLMSYDVIELPSQTLTRKPV